MYFQCHRPLLIARVDVAIHPPAPSNSLAGSFGNPPAPVLSTPFVAPLGGPQLGAIPKQTPGALGGTPLTPRYTAPSTMAQMGGQQSMDH